MREGEGIAAGILESRNVSLGRIRARVIAVLNRPPTDVPDEPADATE